MKYVITFALGVITGLALYRVPAYTVFQDQPHTPTDWVPKMRRWVNGEEVT